MLHRAKAVRWRFSSVQCGVLIKGWDDGIRLIDV
jgi:hypothetical protein